jgi:hypothetical protein
MKIDHSGIGGCGAVARLRRRAPAALVAARAVFALLEAAGCGFGYARREPYAATTPRHCIATLPPPQPARFGGCPLHACVHSELVW